MEANEEITGLAEPLLKVAKPSRNEKRSAPALLESSPQQHCTTMSIPSERDNSAMISVYLSIPSEIPQDASFQTNLSIPGEQSNNAKTSSHNMGTSNT